MKKIRIIPFLITIMLCSCNNVNDWVEYKKIKVSSNETYERSDGEDYVIDKYFLKESVNSSFGNGTGKDIAYFCHKSSTSQTNKNHTFTYKQGNSSDKTVLGVFMCRVGIYKRSYYRVYFSNKTSTIKEVTYEFKVVETRMEYLNELINKYIYFDPSFDYGFAGSYYYSDYPLFTYSEITNYHTVEKTQVTFYKMD